MSDDSGEKTEEPTQKKLDDSRDKGQVWKSRDLTGVAIFLAGLGAVKASWGFVEEEFHVLFSYTFEQLAHPEGLWLAVNHSLWLGLRGVLLLSLPVLLTVVVVAALVDFLQVGPLFAGESLMPKLEKLNPIEGAKNLFSKKQLVELLKSSLKMGLAAYVVFGAVKGSMHMIVSSVRTDVHGAMAMKGELIYIVVVRIGLLFLVFSIFDVWWQRRVYMKDLMMTKDEVKREYKESEGDPHHKAKRREMHMEILESAQMEGVKGADVVVTNPDHVAVALRYEPGGEGAPRIVACATDDAAQALKELARRHNVPLMRNVPLARALLEVPVGQEVPAELHEGVAEVLVFVHSLSEVVSRPSRAGVRLA